MSDLADQDQAFAKHVPPRGKETLLPLKKVSYSGQDYEITKEGLAEILIPQNALKTNGDGSDYKSRAAHKDESARQTVFYNPIQQYNRDLSVLAIRVYADDLAAVRLARQQHREQNLAKVEKRGTKRKRERDHEATKKSETDEGASSALLPEGIEEGLPIPAEITIEGLEKDNDSVLVGADAEIEHSVEEEPKQNEDGSKQRDGEESVNTTTKDLSESKAAKSAPPDAEAEAYPPPKGPKNNKTSPNSQSFRILDALSASGLRALRYAKEVPLTTSITANDLSPSATASIKLNVTHNALASKITTTTSDAVEHMYSTMSRTNGRMPQPYHVIDLDPYGTAAPFLDAAVQAVTDGGLLCVTCTDAGVFASIGYLEKTFSQYGGLPLKGPHAHEGGLRLIIHAIATTAARYGLSVEPLLSLSIDFYARVFVRVHKSPAEVKFLASKTMIVYQCDSGCGSWSTQFLAHAKGREARNGETFYKFTSALGPSAGKECEQCGFRTHLAGPMWGGALHNPFFVQRLLDMLPNLDREVYQTVPRMEGMLSLALEEGLDDPWASYVDSKKQRSLTIGPPPPEQSSTDVPLTNDNLTPTSPPLNRPIPPLPAHHRSHHPFFIHPPTLARTLNTITPSDASLRGALRHLGYLTSRSHTKPGSIITNAPFTVIWEIMREWARRERERAISDANGKAKGPKTVNPNTAGAGIMKNDRSRRKLQNARLEVRERIEGAESVEELEKELEAALYRLNNYSNHKVSSTTTTSKSNGTDTDNTAKATNSTPHRATNFPLPTPIPVPQLHNLDIQFDERLGRDPTPVGPRKRRMVRYQENPRENWGPLGRARG